VTAPGISVVVPTLNRRDAVLRLLRALAKQTTSPDRFEVVVVVDGSTDGTVEAVESFVAPFALRSVVQPQTGLASARNAGARAADREIVLFLDDDMEPAEALLGAHLASHEDRTLLGVVGAAPIVVPPDASPIVRYRAAGFARKLERLASRRTQLAFNDVYGGNFSIRRARFLDAGGYDEAFRAYGHEDYELSLRLARSEGRFVFSPEAIAHQHYAKTLRELAANVESEGRTAVLFARKHLEVLSALTLGSFRRRSQTTRARRTALVTASRLYPELTSRMVSSVEQRERHTMPDDDRALFARYDALFDALYWIGAERALHECGAPRWRIAVRDVERWIRAAL
jgi:glycosyltransferase involved in cell wall biosynthesis